MRKNKKNSLPICIGKQNALRAEAVGYVNFHLTRCSAQNKGRARAEPPIQPGRP